MQVSENLRRIEERSSVETAPQPNVEAARQLFVEQLDFLDKHKSVPIHFYTSKSFAKITYMT